MRGPANAGLFVYAKTWQRFFDSEPVCYLSDMYTAESMRGKGVGRALTEAVCAQAKAAGVKRVYWQTQVDNAADRPLYDKVSQHHGFIVYFRDM